MPSADREQLRGVLEPLWCAALDLPPGEVPGDVSLFELGGYSLMAVSLAAQIAQRLGVEVPGTVLFDHPTLDGVVEFLLTAGSTVDRSAEPESSEAAAPVRLGALEAFSQSELQQAYWLGEEGSFALSSPAYFRERYRVASLDVGALREALRQLAKHQDMLRVVATPDGRQRVMDGDVELLFAHDFRGHSEDDAEARVDRAWAGIDQRLPTLEHGPPLRFDVFITDRGVVVMVIGRLFVFDGLSGYVFADELGALLAGRSLTPLPSRYADYRAAFERFEERAEYKRAWEYWHQRVGELPGAPALARARRPESGSGTMTRRSHRIATPDWARLQARCREHGVTPTMALCAAFCEVLARWSDVGHFTLNLMYGQRLPLVAAPERIIGNFSSTVLLEYDGRAVVGFAERVSGLQRRFGQDLEHGVVSGVRVLREFNRQRGAGPTAAMPVVFASVLGLRPGQDERLFLERLDWVREGGSIQTPQVAFDHQVMETGEGLLLHWDTLDEHYPAGLIDAMFDAYRSLLTTLVEREASWRRPVEIPLSEAQQRSRVGANATAQPLRPRALHRDFIEHARRNPRRPAILTDDRAVSYGELLDASLAISRALIGAGHHREQPVAIVAGKGWRQIAAMFGVLCAGGAYVPLAADIPAARAEAIVRRAGITQLVCTQRTHPGVERWWSGSTIVVDSALAEPGSLGKEVDERLQASFADPESLAYVIYTSGTTGEPKGVMIPHAAAINTIDDVSQRFGIGADDRALGVSSFTFDLSVYDVFGLLSVGGAVVVPRATESADPERLYAAVRRHGVTVWNSVPAYFALLAEYAQGRRDAALPSLRRVLLSGDWIPLELVPKIRQLAPGATLISLGGATEAAIWSNWFEVPPKLPPQWVSVPYGHPLANQQFRVLDSRFRDRPDWVPGELYISGRGLARGYQGSPSQTEAAFLVHPSRGEPMYRTGDWGRYWPDGTLEFLGRQDTQVKVGGFRVELGEIEQCLEDDPDVRAAVAVVHGPSGARRIAAFVEHRAGSDAPKSWQQKLHERAEARLPHYMQPRSIQMIEQLPLTRNGKVDRGALASKAAAESSERDGPRLVESSPAVLTPREGALCELWSEVLPAAVASSDVDFFAAGGSSLAAARLMNAIERRFGVRLPLATLYRCPTVRQLAEALQRATERVASCATWLTAEQQPYVAMVHPIGGDVLCYRGLVSALGDGAGVLGLQAFGYDAEVRPQRSIDANAERYVGVLPYESPALLLGWSFGSVVAYEMARRLRARDGRAPTVVMVDPWLARADAAPPGSTAGGEAVQMFFHDLTGGRCRPLIDAGTPRRERLEQGLAQAGSVEPALARIPLEDLRRMFEVYEANSEALLHYRWQTDPEVEVVLLECTRLDLASTHAHLRPLREQITTLPPSIRLQTIVGDHYSVVVGDDVGEVATRVRERIEFESLRMSATP